MASIGVIKGGLLRAYSGETAIGHATSCNLALTADSVEIDDKDISTFPEYKAIKVKGVLTVDAFFSYDTSNVAPTTLLNSMLNKSELNLKVSTEVQGDSSISFTGIVTAYNQEATVNSITVYSVSFQISGTITVAEITGSVDTTVISDGGGTVIGDSSGIVIGW